MWIVACQTMETQTAAPYASFRRFGDVASHARYSGYATIAKRQGIAAVQMNGRIQAESYCGVGTVFRAVVSHMNLRLKPRMPKGHLRSLVLSNDKTE